MPSTARDIAMKGGGYYSSATIGAKHGFRFGEEFNNAGLNPALPPHVLEKAVPK